MKYYILLSSILISNLFSQTLNGTVIDTSGQPLSHVIVRELHSDNQNDNWTTTNDNGSFSIEVSADSKIELNNPKNDSSKGFYQNYTENFPIKKIH